MGLARLSSAKPPTSLVRLGLARTRCAVALVAFGCWRMLPFLRRIPTFPVFAPVYLRACVCLCSPADHVFGMNATNKEVFSRVGREIVESVVNGYNGAIFCYGQTAAGKTYTMQGSSSRCRLAACLGLNRPKSLRLAASLRPFSSAYRRASLRRLAATKTRLR